MDQPTTGETGGSETILFIEFEEAVRASPVRALETHGYTVLVAGNGMEGWELFERHQHEIHLIVLDLSMPKISGQEVLSRILVVKPGAKVVVTSSLGEIDLTRLQADTALKKPYGLSELLRTVRRVLDGKLNRAELRSGKPLAYIRKKPSEEGSP